MAVYGEYRSSAMSWSNVAKLVGVIIELFDSNLIDERTRISFTLFCIEAGEVSVNDGAASRVGVFEARAATGTSVIRVEGVKSGFFGARATTREGIFLDGAAGE